MPIQGVDILKGKSIHSQEHLLTEICLLSFFLDILRFLYILEILDFLGVLDILGFWESVSF